MYLLLLPVLLSSILIDDPKSPNDFIWKNRVLVIQSSEADSSWFQEKLKQDLIDRKLLVVQFEGTELLKTSYEGVINSPKFLELLRVNDKTDSKWILVGLDGGVKQSGTTFPIIEEVFKTIDAMPMRQSELRKKGD